MKAIHWLTAVAVGVAGFSATVLATPLEGWSVDLDKAFQRAKTDDLPQTSGCDAQDSDAAKPCASIPRRLPHMLTKP